MTPRSIEEIEKAFDEMGISPGSKGVPNPTEQHPDVLEPHVFIRIAITTTPLAGRGDANLA